MKELEITENDWNAIFQSFKAQIEEKTGEPIDNEKLFEILRNINDKIRNKSKESDFLIIIRAHCYMRKRGRDFKLSRIEKIIFNDKLIDKNDLIDLFPYFKTVNSGEILAKEVLTT